jgi:hypothetical protein
MYANKNDLNQHVRNIPSCKVTSAFTYAAYKKSNPCFDCISDALSNQERTQQDIKDFHDSVWILLAIESETLESD